MATTSRLAIPYPAGGDIDDVPNWMNQMAVRLDAIVPPMSHGTLAARPVSSGASPGIADRLYYATDVDPDTIADRANVNGQFYRDNGTGWDPIGPFASKVAVGQFTPPTVTGTFDVTGLGFAAKVVELHYFETTDSDTNNAWGYGVAQSATNRYAHWSRASSNSGGLYQRRYRNNRCIYEIDNNGTLIMEADYVSSLADGYRLSFITAPASTAHVVVWKAWG